MTNFIYERKCYWGLDRRVVLDPKREEGERRLRSPKIKVPLSLVAKLAAVLASIFF